MATPFYTLGEDYGADRQGTGRGYYHTPFVRDYVSPQVPRGEFERWLGSFGGGGGFDRRGQFMRSLYGNTQSGYQAAALNNPGLTYRDYLTKHFANTGDSLWRALTPSQRGENPGQFSGRIRVLGRG